MIHVIINFFFPFRLNRRQMVTTCFYSETSKSLHTSFNARTDHQASWSDRVTVRGRYKVFYGKLRLWSLSPFPLDYFLRSLSQSPSFFLSLRSEIM